jgi:hypothetical protein
VCLVFLACFTNHHPYTRPSRLHTTDTRIPLSEANTHADRGPRILSARLDPDHATYSPRPRADSFYCNELLSASDDNTALAHLVLLQLAARMKLFSARHEYNYSWEEVSTNNWRKYCPWNDKAEHVIGVDVLNRSLDSETGIVSRTA